MFYQHELLSYSYYVLLAVVTIASQIFDDFANGNRIRRRIIRILYDYYYIRAIRNTHGKWSPATVRNFARSLRVHNYKAKLLITSAQRLSYFSFLSQHSRRWFPYFSPRCSRSPPAPSPRENACRSFVVVGDVARSS